MRKKLHDCQYEEVRTLTRKMNRTKSSNAYMYYIILKKLAKNIFWDAERRQELLEANYEIQLQRGV